MKLSLLFKALLSSIALTGTLLGMAQPNIGTATMNNQNLEKKVFAEAPRKSASIFISGHSLTDQPIPDYLFEIANSLGTPLQWNRQYVVGSSIKVRTRGRGPDQNGWSGYRSGYNRHGDNLDVVEELRRPKTVQSGTYDALLITEQHAVLGSLTWNDTVRYLRHFHERLIDGNATGTTYFYESWLSINDKSDPRRWIEYERAASPIWQCIATRINTSLAAEGRFDRIQSLPMGLAMADLVERATSPAGLPGISRGGVREMVDSIFSDNVHNTDLGKYYAALVAYAFIYHRTPESSWYPKVLTEQQAKSLQSRAWAFASEYSKNTVPLSLAECKTTMKKSFINLYWSYTRDTYWNEELGTLRAWSRWLRYVVQWHWIMLRDGPKNPFHFDRVSDRDFWLSRP